MKTNQFVLRSCIILLLIFANSSLSNLLLAQEGYSSAALSMGRMAANLGMIPASKTVIVEEYFNYHKHKLNSPKHGETIALDLKSMPAVNGNIIFQLGINTGNVNSLDEIPPVNVCLVIDRSSSMSGQRIARAKEASIEFVKRLRDKDFVSIVLFDHMVDILVPAQSACNRQQIIERIHQIGVRGSTNLNEGLIKGYNQVVQNYSDEMSNKVIMLTDAITNTGVIDPCRIVMNSNLYNKEHNINISMVGVGVDFNYDLARAISQNDRSSIFFINDADDIKKVFIDEIESLLSPLAKHVKLEIEFDNNLVLENFYGYKPRISGNRITLELDNINSGLTQVFLIEFKGSANMRRGDLGVTASLEFYDIPKKGQRKITESLELVGRKKDHYEDSDLLKNYSIAEMSETIRSMAALYEQSRTVDAANEVSYCIRKMDNRYPSMEDADIKRVYDLLTKYHQTLKGKLDCNMVKADLFY